MPSWERQYRPILLLTVGGVMFAISNAVLWFFIPIIAEKLTNNIFTVGLLLAVPYVLSLIGDIPTCTFSDHYGRRRLFLLGLFALAILGYAIMIVENAWTLLILLALFGLGNLLVIGPVRAYVMDIAPKEKTSEFFGIMEISYQIGFAAGPVIGAVLILQGEVNTGIFCLLAGLASALIILKTNESVKTPKTLGESIKNTIREDRVVLNGLAEFKALKAQGAMVLAATFTVVFADGVVWAIEPLYTKLGYDTTTVGLIMAMFVTPYILFEVPAGIIADRLGKTKMLILGLLTAGSSLILFGITKDPQTMMIYAFISTTGLAIARPAIDGHLTDISAGKRRGCIVGVWDTSEDAAYITSAIIGGLIAETTGITNTMTILGALLILTTPIVYHTVKKTV